MPTIAVEISDNDLAQVELRMSQQPGPATPEAFLSAFLAQRLHDPEPTLADLGFGPIDRDTAMDTNLVARGLDGKLDAVAERVDRVASTVDRIEAKVKALAAIPTPPTVPSVNGAGQCAPATIGPNFRLHQGPPAPSASQPSAPMPAPVQAAPVKSAKNDAYRAWRGRIRL